MRYPKKLERVEAYRICGPDPNDFYPRTFSHWSSEALANSELNRLEKSGMKKKDLSIHLDYLYLDSEHHKYYNMDKVMEVDLDPPNRESVLARLSDKELKVLGLKR